MEQTFLLPLREAIAAGFLRAGYPEITASAVRTPLSDRLWDTYAAAASCYLPQFDGRMPPFPALWGAPTVRAVQARNGWVLLTLDDALFDACVRRVLEMRAPAAADGGVHAVNRLLGCMRHGGTGCPAVLSVQRALLLCLSAADDPRYRRRAADAVERMLAAVPVDARMALTERMGQAADAMARLLAAPQGVDRPTKDI